MRIDLHTHSWVSDGTEPPAELVAAAAAAGLDVVAVTDHDQTAGWDEARTAALAHGLGWVGGMEVTCRVPASGVSVHMLAYGIDPQDVELGEALARLRSSRDGRARTMVERLSEDYPITWADVTEQTQDGATIGRPHIADALVAAGVVRHRSAAFEDMLSARSKYYVGTAALDPVEAVRLIHGAGGVAVMAHPVASKRGRVIADEHLLQVVDAGLDGLEVFHRDNLEPGLSRIKALVRERGLLATGSSDYHGTGKPNRLGENVTQPDQLAGLLRNVDPARYAGFELEDLR